MSESKDIQLYNDWCNSNSKLSFAEYCYQQGAREFAEWLSNTEYVANHDSFILPLRGYFTVDEVVAEWQKGEE